MTKEKREDSFYTLRTRREFVSRAEAHSWRLKRRSDLTSVHLSDRRVERERERRERRRREGRGERGGK